MKGNAVEGNQSSLRSRKVRRASFKAGAPVNAVTVTFRHIEPTDALRQYAERKLTHVAQRLKRPCTVHLILTVDKYRHQGEVRVKFGRLTVTAQEETKDLYAVIDRLADKVARQLKCHLAKVVTLKVRAPSAGEILSAGEISAKSV
ncbi:MAG: ribosome-associated translation inhibitor RaiA [Candidatus Binataceae bacterium]|jgi:putative sigma-54 modulation protein